MAIASGQVSVNSTVGGTAIVPSRASANYIGGNSDEPPTRYVLINNGTGILIYIGGSGVTTTTGYLRELLCTDEFALIVAENHPWAKRRMVPFSELDHQRLLQLPDSFVMRRMIDEICRQHQVRPRIVAEINAIETLLRSLGPLQSACWCCGTRERCC